MSTVDARVAAMSDVEIDELVYAAVRTFQDMRSKHQMIEAVLEATKMSREMVAASLLRLYHRIPN
jgi:hypothetical protein